MNNKRKSKVVDTFMEEKMEKCKIFGKFESMTKKKSSEIWADEEKMFGVKVRRKSVIPENEIFLESLKKTITNSCLRHCRGVHPPEPMKPSPCFSVEVFVCVA